MKRRVLGILGAIVLATLGTIALVAYVQSARDDVIADQRPVDVYVVRETIAPGASLDEIRSRVRLEQVPERLVAPDAVTDLGALAGDLVAATELRAGDQLLAGRLADERTVVGVELPEGLIRLTVELEPQRVIGGSLEAGDTVGVLFSFEPFEIDASGRAATPDPGAPDGLFDPAADPALDPADQDTTPVGPRRTPNMTHYTLHQVMVTSVQFSQRDVDRATEVSTTGGLNGVPVQVPVQVIAEEAPSSSLLVTLAVTPPEAEQLVFAAEFGRIWLTAEGPDVSDDGTRIVTLDEAFTTVPRP